MRLETITRLTLISIFVLALSFIGCGSDSSETATAGNPESIASSEAIATANGAASSAEASEAAGEEAEGGDVAEGEEHEGEGHEGEGDEGEGHEGEGHEGG